MIELKHPSQLALFVMCLGKKWMEIIPELIQAKRQQAQEQAVRDAFNDPNPPEPAE